MARLGLGVGLTRRGGGGEAQTIASLFASDERGAWYDPSDISTLFQDAAGTTPVTAAGQSVGKILDKSGRGNHAVQATASKRPVYRASAGLHWLEFDGVDDTLGVSSGVYFGSASSTIVALTPLENNAGRRTLSAYGTNDVNAAFGIDQVAGAVGGFDYGTTSQFFTVTSSGANVFAWVRSKPGNTAVLRKNSNVLDETTHSGENTEVDGLFIASRGNGNFANTLIFGVVHIERVLTAPEIATTEAFLAAKSGVVL